MRYRNHGKKGYQTGDNSKPGFSHIGDYKGYFPKPYRILYAFAPRRAVILLIGGKKTGGMRGYEQYVPLTEPAPDRSGNLPTTHSQKP